MCESKCFTAQSNENWKHKIFTCERDHLNLDPTVRNSNIGILESRK